MKSTYLLVTVLIYLILLSNNVKAQWVDTGCPYGGYVYAIAVEEPRIFIGTDQGGVYLSSDNGTNWSQANNGLTWLGIKALAFSSSTLFAATSIAGIFRSTDYGANWTEVNSGLSVSFMNTLAVSGSSIYAGARLAVAGGGVFLSTNNGDNWTYIGLTQYEVYSLAISGNNIFAGTSGGVFLYTNNGTSWTAVNSGLTADEVYSLKFSNNNLYAGTSGGIFFSNDNGSNWTDISSATLVDKKVRSIAIYQSNIIVGTDGYGAYLSTNNGVTWEANNTGITTSTTAIYALTISSSKIYAGTLYRGAWERPLTDYVTDVESSFDKLPGNFRLAQNYPNPFNPSTKIEFSIPEASFVQLKVYDVLGNEVATLVDEEQNAGVYRTDFSGTRLTSGTYFYRLKAGNYVEIKKMVLLK